MIDSDKKVFQKAMENCSVLFDKQLDKRVLAAYFDVLKDYSISDLEWALSEHIKTGAFFPRPADIIKHIEGGPVTPDMVVAAAKLKSTPLGVMAAIHIGSWDLDTQDDFYLRQRAHEVILMLPEWRKRHESGRLSPHERFTMRKYGVDDKSHFITGASFGVKAIEAKPPAGRLEHEQ